MMRFPKIDRRSDRGFAVVLAVAASFLFAYVCLAVLQIERGDTAVVVAVAERVRLRAAADAALALTLHDLGIEDQAKRWPIDGTPRLLRYNGVEMTVAVEDERGKIPINVVGQDIIRRLFRAAGVGSEQSETLADSFLDWIDGDDARRPHGAEGADYRAAGAEIIPRDEKTRTADELLHIRGMTPQILDDISRSITLFVDPGGGFSPQTATPLALAVMTGASATASELEQHLHSGLGLKDSLVEDTSIRGRLLTIRIAAQMPGGGARFDRAVVAQFTGDPKQPVWIRSYL